MLFFQYGSDLLLNVVLDALVYRGIKGEVTEAHQGSRFGLFQRKLEQRNSVVFFGNGFLLLKCLMGLRE